MMMRIIANPRKSEMFIKLIKIVRTVFIVGYCIHCALRAEIG